MSEETTFVGIDVSSDHFNVHIFPSENKSSWNMDAKSIKALIKQLKKVSPSVIAMESTGGYEIQLCAALLAEGLPALLVNPHRARQYALGIGILAKTDPIDAYSLARFASQIKVKKRHFPTEEERFLKELLARRRQLIDLRVQEKNRLRRPCSSLVKRSIESIIRTLDDEIKKIDKDLDDTIKGNPEWSERCDLLQTIPGVGKVVAITFVIDVPELGALSPKEIAGLIGVAPYNHDSGKLKGRRMVKGGRRNPRKALYMAVVSGSRCNPRLRSFYDKLRASGKAAKVALVACMRKLLIIMNAMVKAKTPFQEILA
jgi:transposase